MSYITKVVDGQTVYVEKDILELPEGGSSRQMLRKNELGENNWEEYVYEVDYLPEAQYLKPKTKYLVQVGDSNFKPGLYYVASDTNNIYFLSDDTSVIEVLYLPEEEDRFLRTSYYVKTGDETYPSGMYYVSEDSNVHFYGNVGTSISWSQIAEKPTEFTPSQHNHDVADEENSGYMPTLTGNNAQFLSGNGQWLIPTGRILLNSNTTIYVSTTGNDSNDGLTVDTPKATIQGAWNMLANNYDLSGKTVTIQLANGTYTSGLNAVGKLYGQTSSIVIQGNNTTPSNVVFSFAGTNGIFAGNGASISVLGISFTGMNYPFNATGYSSLTINGNVALSGTSLAHFITSDYGYVTITNGSSVNISGSSVYHARSSRFGTIIYNTGSNINITGTPAFSNAFVESVTAGLIQCTATISGSATGKRYNAFYNGIIISSGGGANYFPGDVAGTTATGGLYA